MPHAATVLFLIFSKCATLSARCEWCEFVLYAEVWERQREWRGGINHDSSKGCKDSFGRLSIGECFSRRVMKLPTCTASFHPSPLTHVSPWYLFCHPTNVLAPYDTYSETHTKVVSRHSDSSSLIECTVMTIWGQTFLINSQTVCFKYEHCLSLFYRSDCVSRSEPNCRRLVNSLLFLPTPADLFHFQNVPNQDWLQWHHWRQFMIF